ncbi:flagellar basal body rod protein FlgC [Thermovenabulum gondwanense]|uniref:Flagellar basal-body rod protein FlgC n=1 Tax=Thermovenabulum gondwanense TaxID=520767 RepID=A0A162M9K4_9FIRM|nr:flagellar basal body rod protein FlgC [Thermovenabulum gondwanense]KYO64593.1 Flagellar basal-body rod protein FlgC [Thermovenabulum gondwanense]
MSIFKSMEISASALTAQRLRLDVISSNIANVDTTRTEKGEPYRRKMVVFQEMNESSDFNEILRDKINYSGKGVRVAAIIEDQRPFKIVYDPAHPDADEKGYVRMPNVNIVEEMVDMISATRSYEANVTAINSTKNMISKALEIGKG